MPIARAFTVASRLGLATTLLLFGLIVIGSVVRTTGSGLACPDWPLCQGRLLPPLEFHVLLEWLHRLVALLASLALFATAGWVALHAETRSRLGGLALLAVGLLLVQVLLGALTVWKLLSPAVVSVHLAVGLLLLCCLLILSLVAADPGRDEPAPRAERPAGLLPLLGGVGAATYAQILLGGLVSSHGAGLACPDWPTCNGEWLPALAGPVGLQVAHRLGAYLVALLMIAVTFAARTAPDAGLRAGGRLVLWLTLAQVALGACNVLLGTPPWLSAMHLGAAAAILALMVVLIYRAARLAPAPGRLAVAEAR